MAKLLYAASVQGIQNFIFQTNELKEIIGASELVEKICSEKFAEFINKKVDDLTSDPNAIVYAAGNIKYLFDEKDELLKKVVREYSMAVMTGAPGVTISQTIVSMEGLTDEEAGKKADDQLKVQRNKPMNSLTTGIMGVQRSRKTGLPATHKERKEEAVEYYDQAAWAKRQICSEKDENGFLSGKENFQSKTLCERCFNAQVKDRNFPFNIEDMTQKNDWIAVVHADGNGMGNIVKEKSKDFVHQLKDFSASISEATKKAVNRAFSDIFIDVKFHNVIPIRPIILGGDDFTYIIRGDLAIEFTKKYLEYFEEETLNKVGEKMTACAGIAFIKSSYPFYYGYDLAEQLCKQAKITSDRENSCLMFHKVQDSFAQRWDEIRDRELKCVKDNRSFEFGPYYIKPKENYWTIDNLEKEVKYLEEKDESQSLKTFIRQIASMLKNGDDITQKVKRAKVILDKQIEKIEMYTQGVERTQKGETSLRHPIHDVLSLYTITYQETKNNNEA